MGSMTHNRRVGKGDRMDWVLTKQAISLSSVLPVDIWETGVVPPERMGVVSHWHPSLAG